MSKLKLMIIVGTRPEIIRLSEVIKKCDTYFKTILSIRVRIMIMNSMGSFFRISV